MKYRFNQTIVLFTNSFPFGTGEAFLETEIEYLAQKFHTVFIIPTSKSATQREVPKNVFIGDDFINNRVSRLKRIMSTLVTYDFYNAIFKDFPYSLNISYLKLNFIWSFNTSLMVKIFEGFIQKNNIDLSTTVFYSYWFSSHANAIALLKKKYTIKGIARVHGGDLYESVNGFQTFPYRNFTLNNLNQIFSISNDGIKHIKAKYKVENISLSRLGVFSRGRTKIIKDNNTIHIVSCSYLSAIKRVYLIAEIVKNLKYKKIVWTHFGTGRDDKLDLILDSFDRNHLDVRFEGQKENSYILNFYRENSIDLFINVSTSEGIPVSIMEAMSSGIPTLATDVGGTSEIVKDGHNGFLLKKDFSIKEAINKIDEIKANNTKFSNMAYETWKNEFNAEKNYSEFATILQSL